MLRFATWDRNNQMEGNDRSVLDRTADDCLSMRIKYKDSRLVDDYHNDELLTIWDWLAL